jgi:fumarylacetoacetate (FAA) hydrolase family protein
MQDLLTPASVVPSDHAQAVLIGRIHQPGQGAVLVQVTHDAVFDLSGLAATSSQLLDMDNPAQAVRQHVAHNPARLADTAAVLANSAQERRDPALPWFLAPCDLQTIKAAGVTFVASMLERVIEEQARGDAAKAVAVRQAVVAVIGDNLARVRPGSPEAAKLKDVLIAQGVWSQYLEVGIGPDAEIFTKAPAMSAVGVGAEVGIHPQSHWNNPEPEIVLAVNAAGQIQGASLGNDVNLRDFEGRSALLLGKAKDNNASAAIGPFIRLFDDAFTLDDVRRCDIALKVQGLDGFTLQGKSSMSQISRDPANLVAQAMGDKRQYHQYPDGFMLYLGTMFAPTQDRPRASGDGSAQTAPATGQGFTHQVGDVVTVSTARLGALVNRVNTCDRVPPWIYGITALMRDLARRGLLA